MSNAVIGKHPELVEFIRRLGLNPSDTRRVIIDIPAGNVVSIYVEANADVAAFSIVPPEFIGAEKKGSYDIIPSHYCEVDASSCQYRFVAACICECYSCSITRGVSQPVPTASTVAIMEKPSDSHFCDALMSSCPDPLDHCACTCPPCVYAKIQAGLPSA